ncbi:hypothetical protein [Micromonospora sp. DT229]|uniref:hypothetical protein n=1 Tax=Micromonospora sp. DT229 TaxID=3393430 RepID=UPI003CF275E0
MTGDRQNGAGRGRDQRAVDAPTVVQQPRGRARILRPPADPPTVVIVRADSPTSVIEAVPTTPPVFVDPSGRRRSRLRWIAYGLGLAGALYTGLVAASFLGGPVKSEKVLPFVEPSSQEQPWQPPPAPSLPVAVAPSSAAPTRSAAPLATSVEVRVSASPSPTAADVPSDPTSTPTRPRPTRSTPVLPEPSTEPPSADPSPVTNPPASPDTNPPVDG